MADHRSPPSVPGAPGRGRDGGQDAAALVARDGRIVTATDAFLRLAAAGGHLDPDARFEDLLTASSRAAGRAVLRAAFDHQGPDEAAPEAPALPARLVAFRLRGGSGPMTLLTARRVPELGGERKALLSLEPQSWSMADERERMRAAVEIGRLVAWGYDLSTGESWVIGSLEDLGLPLGTVPSFALVAQRVCDEDRARLVAAVEGLLAGDTDRVSERHRLRGDDDRWRWVRSEVRLSVGEGGARQLLGVTRDISAKVGVERHLRDEYERERQRADSVEEIATLLISATSVEELREVILARIAAAFGGSGTVLAEIDGDRLRVHQGGDVDGLASAIAEERLTDPLPLPTVITLGEPQFVPSRAEYVRRWPAARYLLDLYGAEAFSLIPLIGSGGRRLGGWVITYREEHEAEAVERVLLRALGHLAGQALERIKLQQSRVDLAMALQRSMLPPELPEIPGLRAAARYAPAQTGLDIGGDWYDVFPMAGGAVAFAIGDVQGHDVDAAAFMEQLRVGLRAIANVATDPGQVLGQLNELLFALGSGLFATCTFLRYDPVTKELAAANAGHVPVVWATESERHDPVLGEGNPPIGVVRGQTYPVVRRTLTERGAFALVTDGVVEGPAFSIEEGVRRVAHLVNEGFAGDPDGLADDVVKIADLTGHTDDAAVLVVRHDPLPGGAAPEAAG